MTAAVRIPSPRRQRASGARLVVLGLACGITAGSGLLAAPARAASVRPAAVRPASLFSYDFHAGARGVRFFDIDAKNGSQDGDVPESSANLANGPVGSALAAVAWPGPVASNAGTLILVLRPDAPSQATALNYPVKAEAHTGQNPPTVTNSSVPGATMTATAKGDIAESDANVQNATSDAGTFGPAHAHTRTTSAANLGKSEADSVVQNISFGAGAVKIDSVTSTAEAHSDGVKADGAASTTVNGMTVGGMPATVDQNGVHFGDQGQPVNKSVNDAGQQVLAQSGISMVMSAPTKDVKGSNAAVSGGSLVITWATGAGNPTFVMTIGGAEASVAAEATADEVASLTDTGTPVAGGAGSGGVASLVDTSPAAISPGGLGVASGEAGSGSPVSSLATSTNPKETAPDLTPAAAFGARPTTFGWVLLALIAAALVAFGLRRLTDDLLAERAASACPLDQEER